MTVSDEAPCAICGQPPNRHNGSEKFCAMYATYRPSAPKLDEGVIAEVTRRIGRLCAKLRRHKPARQSYLYGTEKGGLANPDGPEVADELGRLLTLIEGGRK